MTAIRITGGRVHDPANDVDGEVRDVCLEDGKVVADVGPQARRIDARGMVVMPGGVDIHAHIAGPKVNAARKLSPEERRDEPARSNRAAALGHRRPRPVDVRHRLPLLAARLHHCRRGGRPAAGGAPRARRAARHADDRQVVPDPDGQQPGAVRADPQVRSAPHPTGSKTPWRGGSRRPAATASSSSTPAGSSGGSRTTATSHSLDDEVAGFDVTPRQVLEAIGGAVDELGLPHPVHIHANNLGVPGNADTTLDTMRTLSGRQAHFAHLQFHSYGGKPGGMPRLARARAARLPVRSPRDHRRRRPGDVRAGGDDDGRRPGVGDAARPRRRQVDQPRHRGGDRLRDRPLHDIAPATTSTPCSGGSGSSCSCSAGTPGR